MDEADDYFGGLGADRQTLLWALACRCQLDRWEEAVATHTRAVILRDAGRPGTLPSPLIWQMQWDHHFALIAARHLLRCIDRWWPKVPVNPVLRSELIEGRDLLEHWDENMPIFNVTPRQKEPSRRSGKDFAARNPTSGPYGFWSWSSKDGPRLLPNVTAGDLRGLLDAVQVMLVEQHPELGEFVPAPPPSPWMPASESGNGQGYWPRGL